MQNVVLTIHLILALLLTGVVLLQRSEGGGMGLGGGGGAPGGVMTGRQAANALTRLTWIFGIGLFVTSVALTVIAAQQSANVSVMDRLGGAPTAPAPAGNLPQLPAYAPPPGAGQPVTPPAPEGAATTPAAPVTTAPATAPEVPPAPVPTEAPATATTPPVTQAPAPTN